MNNIAKILTILLLALTSCAPSYSQYSTSMPTSNIEAKTVWIDVNFSNIEKSEIKDAILEWQNSLSGAYVFFIKEDFNMESEQLSNFNYDWFILKKDIKDITARKIDENAITLAYANIIKGNIITVIDKRSNNKKLKSIIMHEIGHLLGLSHTDGGLMNSYYTGLECIDKVAAKEIAKILFLRIENIKYCY